MADRSAGPTQIQGEAPHDSPVEGHPVLTGGYASSTAPAGVTAGDAVRSWMDLNGRAVVRPDVSGTLANGVQTTVSSSAVEILAANASRKAAIIQNVGATAMRVGVTGVTATTGWKCEAGDTIVFEMPFCPTAAIFAIRDGGSDTTALAQEIS